MAVLNTAVKYFHSGMTGAPTLFGAIPSSTGAAGSLINLLDTCLINGFNSQTLTSLSVTSNIATASLAGMTYEAGSVINISGATPSSFNGDWRVATLGSGFVTFETSGIADQTATVAGTIKYAPAGSWNNTTVPAGTNIKTYKSTASGATGMILRVDESAGAPNARVVGYESMSDINTGVNPFPTNTQVSGGLYWVKSQGADTTVRNWYIVADDRTFYFGVAYYVIYAHSVVGFGDIISNKASDPYGCIINGHTSTVNTGFPGADGANLCYIDTSSVSPGAYLARNVSGIGTSTGGLVRDTYKLGHSSYFGYSGGLSLAYPNTANTGLYVGSLNIIETSPNRVYRGNHAGIYFCPHYLGTYSNVQIFSNRDRVTNIAGLSGRTLMAMNSYYGPMFYDITGPWR